MNRKITLGLARSTFCALSFLGLALAFLMPSVVVPDRQAITEKAISEQWNKWLRYFSPIEGSYELRPIKAFPGDELAANGTYLWDPTRIVINSKQELFVSDVSWRCLFKFNREGEYIKRVGGKGQGPGEFMNPYCLTATENEILISDTGNYNIQKYDFEGNLADSFKVFKAYLEIAATHRDQLIIAAPLLMQKNTPLLDILDGRGHLVRSLLTPPYQYDKRWNLANMVKIAIDPDDNIVIAFVYFPLVRIINKEGQPLREIKIENRIMSVKAENNARYLGGDEKLLGLMPLIASVKASREGIYLLQNYPIAEVLEYDKSGKLINEYWYKTSEDLKISDFDLIKTSENKRTKLQLFMVQMKPEPKVLAFELSNEFWLPWQLLELFGLRQLHGDLRLLWILRPRRNRPSLVLSR